MLILKANGPAIKGGCVTRREHRAGSWYFSRETVTVQGGYGACFCHQGTRFCGHYECRGTSFIGAGKLSRYRIIVGGTGAAIAVQGLSKPENYHGAGLKLGAAAGFPVQLALQIYLGCRSNAKTVTNNLPLLSVLWAGLYFIFNTC
jgi:hypothetical protein